MKHAYTRRSNVNSKVQANMHTSWNNQCNPDMQCSNTWTIETSKDCKSNTRSNKNWVLLEGLGQVGFQLRLKWGVCLWRKADYSRLFQNDALNNKMFCPERDTSFFLGDPSAKTAPWQANILHSESPNITPSPTPTVCLDPSGHKTCPRDDHPRSSGRLASNGNNVSIAQGLRLRYSFCFNSERFWLFHCQHEGRRKRKMVEGRWR